MKITKKAKEEFDSVLAENDNKGKFVRLVLQGFG